MNREDEKFGIYDARIYGAASTRGRKPFPITEFCNYSLLNPKSQISHLKFGYFTESSLTVEKFSNQPRRQKK
jgi:hypothetical protein